MPRRCPLARWRTGMTSSGRPARPAGAVNRKARDRNALSSPAPARAVGGQPRPVGPPHLPGLDAGEQVRRLVIDERGEAVLGQRAARGAGRRAGRGPGRRGRLGTGSGQGVRGHDHPRGGVRDPVSGRGEDVQHPPERPGRAGQDPDGIERRRQRQDAAGADQAVGRPEAEQPARRRRDPDRAAGVGAEADVGEAGRDRGRRPGRRPAREPAGVLRVQRCPALAGIADQRPGELVELGQARHRGARRQQPRHRRRGAGARPVRRAPPGMPERGRPARDGDHVLDRDGQAVQRPGPGRRQAG
jgi:hypothetical protein